MIVEMDGSGTEEDPYLIRVAKQLQAVSQELDAHYKLVNDIDSSKSKTEEFEAVGDGENSFNGTFDGNNYAISNLRINRPDENYVGLFGYIGRNGQVKNLGLINPSIKGKNYVGSLVGENNGEIVCSYVREGQISGKIDIGGLVGWNDGNIESSCTVKSNVSGDIEIGGLIGLNWGEVESSYTVKVDVSGGKVVGGLVGENSEDLQSSYSIDVDLSGDKQVGGLVGMNCEEPLDSSFILSRTDKTLDDTDLVLSRENHRISYVVETRIVYVQIDDETYSGGGVSPIIMQSLLNGTEVVKITERFRASVVSVTQD